MSSTVPVIQLSGADGRMERYCRALRAAGAAPRPGYAPAPGPGKPFLLWERKRKQKRNGLSFSGTRGPPGAGYAPASGPGNSLFSFWERSGLRSGSCAASKGVLQ